MFGHISGAHLNPAVTIAAAILGKIPLIMIPFYLIAQFSGAIAGYGILMVNENYYHQCYARKKFFVISISFFQLCFPEELKGFCLTMPAGLLTEGQVIKQLYTIY